MIVASLLLAAQAHAAFSPNAHLRWDVTGEQVAADCAAAKKRAESRLHSLAAVSPEGRSFDNTPGAFDEILAELDDETASDVFLKDVAVSSSTRQAAHECATLLEQFSVDVFTRDDLYRALRQYAAKKEKLAAESQRLLDKTLLDFKRNGLDLPEEKRYAAKKIKQRLAAASDEFARDIAEDKSSMLVTKEELDGLPDDFVARLPQKDGRYVVSVDYPDYFPFMENAKSAAARRRLDALFNNRAAKLNVPLLKEILSLREEAARLLGYKNHAAYRLEIRMAKNPETVDRFTSRLVKRLKPLGKKELAALVAAKDAEEGAKSDHVIDAWDWRYYDNQLRKKNYDVDEEKIKDYFPLDTVTAGLFNAYQTLLAVKFRKVDDASAWAPGVTLYQVEDAGSGEVLAYFFMDMFPREGKYKHFASFDIIGGRRLADGSYQKPVSAIVGNFPTPAAGKPSLLKHGEHGDVETYFHEFGHIMHQTLTKARFSRFAGSKTARDFVEAPSQMLENWVWDPAVLATLSGRYDDPSQKLPKELLERMIAARNHDVALKALRQLLFARTDFQYHTESGVDTTAVWAKNAKNVMMIPIDEGTHPEASFGHLMGYDAGYYGYMWSKVYAEDMFGKFKLEGLLNPALGRRYREEILEKGSSRDELESLEAFLGRAPNEDAFLKSIGLNQTPGGS